MMKSNEWLVKRFNEDIAFAIIYHTLDQSHETYMLEGTPVSIGNLFTWNKTPEGEAYWKEIQLIEEIFNYKYK
jgi:hypothetical protein